MRFDKHILLCAAGTTPQVVMETLWALMKQGERIDEIRVITTLEGRDRLRRQLLDPEKGQFFAFCRDYEIDPASINFSERNISLLHLPDGRLMDDIRTPEENRHAANQICEIVRELTRDEKTRIIASAAGGRKTMSIYLTTGMQLFARSWDTLSHVLVSRDFEMLEDFCYIPPTPREVVVRDDNGQPVRTLSTADAEIHLAPIAFIRLRGILDKVLIGEGKNYAEIVESIQNNLDLVENHYDLQINIREKTVKVAGRSAKLTEREFFFYLLFAWYRWSDSSERKGRRDINEIEIQDLEKIFRFITGERGDQVGLEETRSISRFVFLDTFSKQVLSSKTCDKEDIRKGLSQTRTKINKRLTAAGIPARYHLASGWPHGETVYGIEVMPDAIRFNAQQVAIPSPVSCT